MRQTVGATAAACHSETPATRRHKLSDGGGGASITRGEGVGRASSTPRWGDAALVSNPYSMAPAEQFPLTGDRARHVARHDEFLEPVVHDPRFHEVGERG